jgi:hypothetical protein
VHCEPQVGQWAHERRIMAVARRPLPHGERLVATEDSSLTAWDPASGAWSSPSPRGEGAACAKGRIDACRTQA